MSNSVTKTMGDLIFTFQQKGSNPTKGILTTTKPNGDGNDSVNPLLSDTFDIGKDNLRRGFIDKLLKANPQIETKAVNVRADMIRDLMLLSCEVNAAAKKQNEQPDTPAEVNPLKDTTPEELKVATDMLESDNLFEQIAKDIRDLGIVGEEHLTMAVYIIMVSRLLDKPLFAIIQGISSGGKSFVLETIARL